MGTTAHRSRILFAFRTLVAIVTVLVIAPGAMAEGFSSTDVSIQHGTKYHDPYSTGTSAADGVLNILQLEHYGTWAYGDNYFFVDVYSGDETNFDGTDSGQNTAQYMEWHPRLSLSKITGTNLSFGIVKDIYIAGELNYGNDASSGAFQAYLGGIGFDFAVPVGHLGMNVYWRNDNFNRATYQVSPFWSFPFSLGSAKFVFDGYVDVSGTDSIGTDIKAGPALWLDVGALTGHSPGKLEAGVQYWYHHNDAVSAVVPNLAVRWHW